MRVLLVNTSERTGGAAVAANRLMEALKNNGIKAKMLVRDKQTDQITVVALDKSWRNAWNFLWERVVLWAHNHFSRRNIFAVDIANTGADITSLPEFKQADVIHLHWINQGMLSISGLRKIFQSGKPVVWTMHDMWPCTAICHHARTCNHFHTHCHNCPYLAEGTTNKDLSYKVFDKKKMLYRGVPIAFVACSHWLEDEARKSALTMGKEIFCIPNTINTNLFCPRDKQTARRKCDLPDGKRFILFSAAKVSDKRKGIDYLIKSCQILTEKNPALRERLAVVVVGAEAETLQDLFTLPVFSLGYVADEHQMVNVYNAVDLYVTPSLEENLPNTIMEAMACGVPCVGFNVGGIPEMIDHLHNGYVADFKNAEDFANGICWTLDDENYAGLSEICVRKVAENYSEGSVAMRYIDIYNKVTNQNNDTRR